MPTAPIIEALEARVCLASGGAAPTLPSDPNAFIRAGDSAFFFARTVNDASSTSLWRTDGTSAGTTLVRGGFPVDFHRTKDPQPLAWAHGLLYFAAFDVDHGKELWVSDGTAQGTRLIKDLNPGADNLGPEWSEPRPYSVAIFGGKLYFAANYDYWSSRLWATDGTAEGTVEVLNPYPEGSSGSPVASGDYLYFLAVTGRVPGDPEPPTELWRSDGTSAGTIKLRGFRSVASEGRGVAIWHSFDNGSVLFVAPSADFSNTALWRSDGTPEGTVLVENVTVGEKARSGDNVYFGSHSIDAGTGDPVYGLWKTDGTAGGTVPVLERSPGSTAGLNPSIFADLDGILIFRAFDPEHGVELWRSDGTAEGTWLVKDIQPGPGHSGWPLPMAARAGDFVLFYADDGIHGVELWKTDGTDAGTVMVRDLVPGPEGSQAPYVGVNSVELPGGLLVFRATDAGGDVEPWLTDGTDAGTMRLADLNVARASVISRQLFFNNSAFDGYTAGADARDDAATPTGYYAMGPWDWPVLSSPTSYSRGINGMLVDVKGLPHGVELDASDFEFSVSVDGGATGWKTAMPPTGITTRRGAGWGGSDRVTIIWQDGSILNTFLRVAVVPTTRTGLAADLMFYCNLVGNVNDSFLHARVDARDLAATRRAATFGRANVTSRFDHDRNGWINRADVLISRRQLGRSVEWGGVGSPSDVPVVLVNSGPSQRIRPTRRGSILSENHDLL